jgi:hypothetical protein
MVNPAVNFPIRGTGEKAWFGWPTDPKMEELREAWFNATSVFGFPAKDTGSPLPRGRHGD